MSGNYLSDGEGSQRPTKNWLSDGNSKLAATAKALGVRILTWGIPAYESRDGFRTCPLAGECAKGCYARQGAYTWSNVSQAFERRLQLARSPGFVATIVAELQRRQPDYVRVHDSGDFFSQSYFQDWRAIALSQPAVQFYAYTKMVPLFKRLTALGALPANFTLIYSYGGSADALIDPQTDRHSVVFASHAERVAAGYADATENDLIACGPELCIGLVYHGATKRAWSIQPEVRV